MTAEAGFKYKGVFIATLLTILAGVILRIATEINEALGSWVENTFGPESTGKLMLSIVIYAVMLATTYPVIKTSSLSSAYKWAKAVFLRLLIIIAFYGFSFIIKS